MPRPIASTTDQLTPVEEKKQGFQFRQIQIGQLPIDDLTPGLVTAIPRARRPPGSATILKNARTRDDWVGRRPGHSLFNTKPDANSVLKVASLQRPDNENWIVRVAVGSTHVTRTRASWTALTPTGGASHFTTALRVSSAQAFDWLFLANFQQKIVRVDPKPAILEQVKEAPVAKFITAFAERLIAAYIAPTDGGVASERIQWSANADPFDWTAPSAGVAELVSAGEVGDEITGIFGLESHLIILRKNSVWIAERQPIEINPFRFRPIITDFGCDAPFSAVKVPGGVIFADTETKGVYLYSPASGHQKLNTNIEGDIFEGAVAPELLIGSYDPAFQEYHLGIATDPGNALNLTKTFVYSQRKNSWTEDIGPTATVIGVVAEIGTPTMIDELTGFIDGLLGVIDELSGLITPVSVILKGNSVGELLEQTFTAGTDNGVAFDFDYASQDLSPVPSRRTLQRVRAVIEASGPGTTSLFRSGDNANWGAAVKTIADPSPLDHIGFKKPITKNKLFWRVTSRAPNFKMFEWWAKVIDKEEKRVG